MATATAVEEVMVLRCMLWCLRVKVTKLTWILGDNHSIVLNSSIPSSLLKKKHVAISYHMAREAMVAKIVHPVKTKGDWNIADVLTKPQTRKAFGSLIIGMMCQIPKWLVAHLSPCCVCCCCCYCHAVRIEKFWQHIRIFLQE
eukprot:9716521-Ditylum_brightwellii.AAC.1